MKIKEYPIYLAGDWVKTKNELKVFNPHTKEHIGTTFIAGKSELEFAISQAKKVESELRELPSFKRFKVLQYISDELFRQRESLAFQLASEAAKPLKYALGEIDRAAQTFLVAAEESKRLPGEIMSLDWTNSGKGKEGIIKYFPIGLIAGIAPFNFPLNLAVHKIAPAMAAGNAIILKPSRSTPLSVLALAKIIAQTDWPKGAISILPTDREAGNQLVTDTRINMLSFTGSPEVGWDMKTKAGKKKIALELGGNAGVIVSESVENLNDAVQKCLVGSFAYSGQVCIHVQRIYVQKSIFDSFVDKFIESGKKLKLGNPTEPDTDICSMIDETNALRVKSWIDEAVRDGAKILLGGNRHHNYVEPTVLSQTKKAMKVCSLEIFGPVVCIEVFEDFRDAIAQVNDSEFGLQAGVFTNKLSEMNDAFNYLEVGGVIINDVPSFRVDHMPYGGVKNSGFGREGVKFTIHEMMEPRLLVKNF